MPEPTKKGRSVDSEDGISLLLLVVTSKHITATQKIQNEPAVLHVLINLRAKMLNFLSTFMLFMRLACLTVMYLEQFCFYSIFACLLSLFEGRRVSRFLMQ